MATERIDCLGVVLSASIYGESDRIVRMYTDRKGKISVMAKGAKSVRSRTLPLTEVFTYGRYRLSAGKTFYYLNGGKILESNLAMREEYDRLIYGSALVEIADRSSLEGEGTPRIFSLLRKSLHILAHAEEPLWIFLGFVIKYVSYMGYRPLIPNAIEGEYIFLPDKGIVKKEDGGPHGTEIDSQVIYTFRHLLYTSLDKIDLGEISPAAIETVYRCLTEYVVVNLELERIQSLQLRM